MGFFRKKAELPLEEVGVPQAVSLSAVEDIAAVQELVCAQEPQQAVGEMPKKIPEYGPHIIVFANEKGGVGKSTTAFHTCVALANAGESVVVVDLDQGQQSLAKILRKRQDMVRHLEVDFAVPKIASIHQPNAASLDEILRTYRRSHSFVVIDVAGHDSAVARHAIKLANTVVTPINDSFVDIEVLGHIDPTNLRFGVLAPFSRLVQNAMQSRHASLRGPIEWVVVKNRLRSVMTLNGSKFAGALKEISEAAGFRMVAGLHERVIYRELIPFGLTLLDLPLIPEMARAHPTAENELKSLLREFKLPTQVPF